MKQLLEEYGRLAIVIYLVLFAATFSTVFVLLQFGFKEDVIEVAQQYLGQEVASAGTLVFAYAITKVTQPIRIALTALLLPLFRTKSKKEVLSDDLT